MAVAYEGPYSVRALARASRSSTARVRRGSRSARPLGAGRSDAALHLEPARRADPRGGRAHRSPSRRATRDDAARGPRTGPPRSGAGDRGARGLRHRVLGPATGRTADLDLVEGTRRLRRGRAVRGDDRRPPGRHRAQARGAGAARGDARARHDQPRRQDARRRARSRSPAARAHRRRDRAQRRPVRFVPLRSHPRRAALVRPLHAHGPAAGGLRGAAGPTVHAPVRADVPRAGNAAERRRRRGPALRQESAVLRATGGASAGAQLSRGVGGLAERRDHRRVAPRPRATGRVHRAPRAPR